MGEGGAARAVAVDQQQWRGVAGQAGLAAVARQAQPHWRAVVLRRGDVELDDVGRQQTGQRTGQTAVARRRGRRRVGLAEGPQVQRQQHAGHVQAERGELGHRAGRVGLARDAHQRRALAGQIAGVEPQRALRPVVVPVLGGRRGRRRRRRQAAQQAPPQPPRVAPDQEAEQHRQAAPSQQPRRGRHRLGRGRRGAGIAGELGQFQIGQLHHRIGRDGVAQGLDTANNGVLLRHQLVLDEPVRPRARGHRQHARAELPEPPGDAVRFQPVDHPADALQAAGLRGRVGAVAQQQHAEIDEVERQFAPRRRQRRQRLQRLPDVALASVAPPRPQAGTDPGALLLAARQPSQHGDAAALERGGLADAVEGQVGPALLARRAPGVEVRIDPQRAAGQPDLARQAGAQRGQRDRLELQRELDANPPRRRPVGQRQCAGQTLAQHHLGRHRRRRRRHARPARMHRHGARRQRHRRGRPQLPDLVAQMLHGPARQRGDGQRGIGAERGGDDGAVEHDERAEPAGGGAGRAAVALVEHPAVGVDRAAGGVVAHRATAQRMDAEDGAELFAQHGVELLGQQTPQRIGQDFGPPGAAVGMAVGPVELVEQALHALDLLAEQGLRLQARPFDVDQAVAQRVVGAGLGLEDDHPAGRVVAIHAQQHGALQLSCVDGGRVDRASGVLAGVGLRHAVQQVGGGEELVEHPLQGPGNGELLGQEARRAGAAGAVQRGVDDAGDGRADAARPAGRHAGLVGPGIDLGVHAVDGHHVVAVGGILLAEAGRKARLRRARAQQDFGAAERPCRQDDLVGAQHIRLALVLARQLVGVHDDDPPAPAVALEAQHGGAGDQPQGVRRAAPGLGQQAGVERQFGAVVATGHAVAAVFAAVQVDAAAGGVAVLLEHHADVGRAEFLAAQLGDALALRQVADAVVVRRAAPLLPQQLGHRAEARAERAVFPVRLAARPGAEGLAHFFRPGRPGEHLGQRLLEHAGVDQRAAAQPVSQQGGDVDAHAHVEQAVAQADRHQVARLGIAHVSRQLGQTRGEHARKILVAALEHADAQRLAVLLGGAGQLGGRDRAAKAAADDEHVVVARAGLVARHHHVQVQRQGLVGRAVGGCGCAGRGVAGPGHTGRAVAGLAVASLAVHGVLPAWLIDARSRARARPSACRSAPVCGAAARPGRRPRSGCWRPCRR